MLLLRRLWQPLPLSSSICRCGRPLDSRGHHRAACSVAGVLGRRGFALESAAARVCREAGGRVTRCKRWTFSHSDRLTTAVWRSSLMASPCSGERNWPSTPRWSLRSAATLQPGDNAPRPTELRCCRHEGAKRGRTQSSLETWSGPDWWCSVARSGEGGPLRPAGARGGAKVRNGRLVAQMERGDR